jgi:transposase
MLSIPEDAKIYLCLEITDMRRSFDKLSAMVSEYLAQDPLSGHFFIFRNKASDKIKILYWDTTGYCLWYKRLERGTFMIPPGLKADFEMSRGLFEKLLKPIPSLNMRYRKK